ncbi:MAG: DUF3459 domain-containing protein, partial [Deltaproteobacteria bacterium]|nr:DUF3459 domain-containing protein [Deltaproteobacteria bacterium]
HHKTLLEFYRELLLLRKDHPVLSRLNKDDMEVMVYEGERVLFVRRWRGSGQTAAVFHFGDSPASLPLPLPPGRWDRLLDSSERRWGGAGGSPALKTLYSHGSVAISLAPKSFVLFSRA